MPDRLMLRLSVACIRPGKHPFTGRTTGATSTATTTGPTTLSALRGWCLRCRALPLSLRLTLSLRLVVTASRIRSGAQRRHDNRCTGNGTREHNTKLLHRCGRYHQPERPFVVFTVSIP